MYCSWVIVFTIIDYYYLIFCAAAKIKIKVETKAPFFSATLHDLV